MESKLLKPFYLIVLLISLAACSSGGSDGLGIVLSESAFIVDETDATLLDGASVETNTLLFEGEPAFLAELAVDDIIVLGVTGDAPHGLIRRVISISVVDGNTVIVTEEAALTDVVEEGAIKLTGEITLPVQPVAKSLARSASFSSCEETDREFSVEIAHTLAPGVTASGCVDLSISYELEVKIEKGKLVEFIFTITPIQNHEIEIVSSQDHSALEEFFTLATYELPVIETTIGKAPIVIVPELSIVGSLEGDVSVNLTTGAASDLSATVGVELDGDTWLPIVSRESDFLAGSSSVDTTADMTVSIGPELTMKMFGHSGPSASVQAYISIQSDLAADPDWQLFGGLKASVSVLVAAIDRALEGVEIADILSYQELLDQGGLADTDEDGIPNYLDSCELEAPYRDTDGDGCDDQDTDSDGVYDLVDDDSEFVQLLDNCPLDENANQVDTDNDGQGDVCDDDQDNDFVFNESDNCPLVENAGQEDTGETLAGDACEGDWDGDGVVNETDLCPYAFELFQHDNDSDFSGDACDADDDNDGHLDANDNCPIFPNIDQTDVDGDLVGDVCDHDIDGDAVDNISDNCPLVSNFDQFDADADGEGDVCDSDSDTDADLIVDMNDNCPIRQNSDQANFDGDSYGDVCDQDDDNDGIIDMLDVCPFETPSVDEDLDGCEDI